MSNYFDQLAETWDQDSAKIERSRVTAEYCKRVSFYDNTNLLDFGGGTGLLSLYLHDSFKFVTIADSSKEMLRVAQEKIKEAKIVNIQTLEINDDISEIPDTYSAVITLMTLHHIVDIDQFFRSTAKILNDSGALIIADLYKEDGSFHQHVQDYNGHNGFEMEQLSEKLEKAGFKVTQVSQYFEIKKENSSGKEQSYPLFFLVAEKQAS